ncbi:SPATS2-like protein [Tachyglossus aculeatus]|uniref:SPATS2-like protein n=1 Tax=Tachyglossus aculeatus TaxID=9261 RepID=UPI0018F2932F|nr:SPATS2-like protein [Tachyglossus aculeatus]
MAEIPTQVNIKEKIFAVRSAVPNRRKSEIVVVLQQFDNNVDKAVQAFVDGSAVQVLKEWNMTGKKKINKRKKSKWKQHPGGPVVKERVDGKDPNPPGSAGFLILPLSGCCGKGHFPTGPVQEKTEAEQQGKNPSLPPDSLREHPKATGPNIEKSLKDLQRCTLSLARYRLMIKEEVDLSVKKIKAAFAELHVCITDKEKSLMAEMEKVKEEAMGILNARQKKAEELKRLTDLAKQMADTQLSELRAEIKHFVSERKYDEELGRAARFSCDVEQLKGQISLCGEISHPKDNYSARAGCSWLLPSVGRPVRSRGKAAPRGPVLRTHRPEEAHGDHEGDHDGHHSRGPARPQHLITEASPAASKDGPSGQRRRPTARPRPARTAKGPAGPDVDQPGKAGPRHHYRRPQTRGPARGPEAAGVAEAAGAEVRGQGPSGRAAPEKPRRRRARPPRVGLWDPRGSTCPP